MRFRHRPTEIEAAQWFPGRATPGVHGQLPAPLAELAIYPERTYRICEPSCVPMHQIVTMVHEGDWIVRERDGIHYRPIPADLFEACYEPIDA